MLESHFLLGAVLIFNTKVYSFTTYIYLDYILVYIKYMMVYYTRVRTVICDVLVMFICVCYDPIGMFLINCRINFESLNLLPT